MKHIGLANKMAVLLVKEALKRGHEFNEDEAFDLILEFCLEHSTVGEEERLNRYREILQSMSNRLDFIAARHDLPVGAWRAFWIVQNAAWLAKHSPEDLKAVKTAIDLMIKKT